MRWHLEHADGREWTEEVAVSRCPHGEDPSECPDALGVYIDGIRWDGDGGMHRHTEWRPVCVQGELCPAVHRR